MKDISNLTLIKIIVLQQNMLDILYQSAQQNDQENLQEINTLASKFNILLQIRRKNGW